MVGGTTQVVTGAGGTGPATTATFGLAPTQTTNFFDVYFDSSVDASDLSGTGFNDAGDPDATRIFGGTVTVQPSSNFSAFMEPGDGFRNLDENNDVDNFPDIDSVAGSGSTELTVTATFVDPDFFTNFSPGDTLEVAFNTSQTTPFTTTDPSEMFLTTATTTSEGVSPSTAGAGAGTQRLHGDERHPLGTVNGDTPAPGGDGGSDFQFLADGNFAFNFQQHNAIVPEPSTFAIMLTGSFMLLGAGFVRRRRRSTDSDLVSQGRTELVPLGIFCGTRSALRFRPRSQKDRR